MVFIAFTPWSFRCFRMGLFCQIVGHVVAWFIMNILAAVLAKYPNTHVSGGCS